MTTPAANADLADPNGLPPLLVRLERGIAAVAEALAEEAAAIGTAEPERLLAAVAGKRRALRELESCSGDPRLPSLLDPVRSPWSDTAQRLLGQLRSCEQHNLANGSVLVGARRDNATLLRLLGHAPEGTAYGNRGEAPPAAARRSLGRA